LGFRLRDALQEGTAANAVACLPRFWVRPVAFFLVFAWWFPLPFLIRIILVVRDDTRKKIVKRILNRSNIKVMK
jgi:hypothetical protein